MKLFVRTCMVGRLENFHAQDLAVTIHGEGTCLADLWIVMSNSLTSLCAMLL
jgi:hypothetical protein